MRLATCIPALLAARPALAAVISHNAQSPTDTQIVRALLDDPKLLGPSSTSFLEKLLGVVGETFGLHQAITMGNIATVLGTMGSYLPSGSKAPASSVPEMQEGRATEFPWPGVKKVKARYGPFRIPATSETNVESRLMNVKGMGYALQVGARKPCEGDCTMLSLQASLEFADGSPAENEKGAWFHHATLLASGPSVVLAECQTFPIENLFMSGNERSRVYFGAPASPIRSGYKLTANDRFILHAKLMNLEDREKFVWLTIDYDYVDGHDPAYRDGRMTYMSLSPSTAGTCGTGDAPFGASNLTKEFLPTSLKFMEHSLPWTAERDGLILSTGGHMHDGGEAVETWFNDKMLCASIPTYAKGGMGMGGHGHKRKRQLQAPSKTPGAIEEHIASQTRCNWPDGVPLKKGDKMYLSAVYDFEKHPGMTNKKGQLDEVMGIVGTLIAY